MKANAKTIFGTMLALFLSLLSTQASHVAAAERHNPTLEYKIEEGGALVNIEETELIQNKVEKLDGWYTLDGKVYYFEDGKLQSGFQTIDGKTYYFNEEESTELGTQFEDNFKALSSSQDLKTGWFSDLYGIGYRDEFGAMVTGKQEIDGIQYNFNEEGHMITSEEIDGFFYDENGQGRPVRNRREDIAKAALAQLGVAQDCTMLVTNSLKAVGINFHGAPWKYAQLGSFTDDPQPGDICLYQGHVAIYIGDGMAVHGGWNGGTTAIFTVECSAPFIGYIRVDLPEQTA